MNIVLIRAGVDDAHTIWEMQKEAFAQLLAKYGDLETNPGNEPLEKTVLRLKQPFTYFYKIVADGKTVGAVRVIDKTDGSPKRISSLFVMPKFRRMGIATATVLKVEELHGKNNWELDTILQEETNCRLYEKLGYSKTGKTKPVNEKMTLVFYAK